MCPALSACVPTSCCGGGSFQILSSVLSRFEDAWWKAPLQSPSAASTIIISWCVIAGVAVLFISSSSLPVVMHNVQPSPCERSVSDSMVVAVDVVHAEDVELVVGSGPVVRVFCVDGATSASVSAVLTRTRSAVGCPVFFLLEAVRVLVSGSSGRLKRTFGRCPMRIGSLSLRATIAFVRAVSHSRVSALHFCSRLRTMPSVR